MSITNGYANVAEMRQWLGGVQGGSEDDLFERAIESASRSIDKRCGRYFYKDAAVSARFFTSEFSDELLVRDISTATGLVVEADHNNDGAFENTYVLDALTGYGYRLEPLNAAADTKPFTSLLVLSQPFPINNRGMKVTAKWGWPALPIEITEATLIQATAWYKRKDAPFGAIGQGDTGFMRMERSLDPDVRTLIDQYRRMHIGAV